MTMRLPINRGDDVARMTDADEHSVECPNCAPKKIIFKDAEIQQGISYGEGEHESFVVCPQCRANVDVTFVVGTEKVQFLKKFYDYAQENMM